MALTTYTELKSAVADFLNRDDLTAAIPTFISLAEAGFDRVLRTRQMVARTSLTVNSEFEALPADFLESRALKVAGSYPMQFVAIEDMDTLAAQYPSAGEPTHYTTMGSELRFHPVPDTSYTAELTYFQAVDKLSGSVASNWLLTAAPDIYLYGALMQSAPYLKDDARLTVWGQLYTSAVEQLNRADDRAAHTGGNINIRARSFGV